MRISLALSPQNWLKSRTVNQVLEENSNLLNIFALLFNSMMLVGNMGETMILELGHMDCIVLSLFIKLRK